MEFSEEDYEAPFGFWDKWTSPSIAIRDRVQRQQSQLFSQFVLVTLWTASVCSVLYAFVVLGGEDRVDFGIRSLPAFAFLGFVYLLGRSKWYLVGVIAMTGGLVTSGTTVIILGQEASVVITMLILGLLAVVNAGATLPPWAVGLTGLGAVVNIALFSTLYSSVPKTPLFGLAAGFVILTAVYCWRGYMYLAETHDRRTMAMRQVQWLRTMQESFYAARVPLCQVSEDGLVESANTALGQMFGLAVPALIGIPLEAIGDGKEALDNPLNLYPLLSGSTSRVNTRRRFVHRDQDVLTAKVAVGASVPTESAPVLVAALEDITPYMDALEQREKRRVELRRIAEERLEMLSLVTREIRTPMTGVVGALEVLKKGELSDLQREYLDIIESSTHSLVQVIEEAIEGTKPQGEGSDEDFATVEIDVGALVEEVCRLAAPPTFEKGVELICEIDRNVPRLMWTQAARLHQIVTAALDNAILHTYTGTVYCGVRALNTGLLRAKIEIEVAHSLSGSVPAAFGDIFEETTSDPIRPIVSEESLREWLHQLDGTIESSGVESGRSVVRMHIEMSVGTEKRMSGSRGALSGRRIWVVMEPYDTQMAVARMLSQHGAQIQTHDVAEFIEGMEARDWSAVDVDVVLIDVGLTTMNGTSVVGEILRHLPSGKDLNLVHVGSTGQLSTLARHTAMYGGGQLVKPITSRAAIAILNREFEPLILEDADEEQVQEPTEVTDHGDAEMQCRILLVEDEPVHRKVLVRMLADIGCHVEAVGDGIHGIEMFLSRPYDIILMDRHLPSLGGLEATKKIRTGEHPHRDIPIIAISASALEKERALCLQAGSTEFVAKPISRVTLEEIVQRYSQDG